MSILSQWRAKGGGGPVSRNTFPVWACPVERISPLGPSGFSRLKRVLVTPGKVFANSDGPYHHDDMVGKSWGAKVWQGFVRCSFIC